jgi:hypothetical protein
VAVDFGGDSPGASPGSTGAPPLADSRGADWGVPEDQRGAIRYSRPIRVTLDLQQLVILPEPGDTHRPTVVPLGASGTVASAIDPFVAALWNYMEGWGLAGPNSYWKPVLNVEVAPGAELRYAELARLLEGSGIDVTRK